MMASASEGITLKLPMSSTAPSDIGPSASQVAAPSGLPLYHLATGVTQLAPAAVPTVASGCGDASGSGGAMPPRPPPSSSSNAPARLPGGGGGGGPPSSGGGGGGGGDGGSVPPSDSGRSRRSSIRNRRPGRDPSGDGAGGDDGNDSSCAPDGRRRQRASKKVSDFALNPFPPVPGRLAWKRATEHKLLSGTEIDEGYV